MIIYIKLGPFPPHLEWTGAGGKVYNVRDIFEYAH